MTTNSYNIARDSATKRKVQSRVETRKYDDLETDVNMKYMSGQEEDPDSIGVVPQTQNEPPFKSSTHSSK
jgi:hypothetical protein